MDPLFYGKPNIIYQAIHANWPTYPSGEGWQYALADLCNFPTSTKFYQIDDIDKCLLFTDTDPAFLKSQKKDVYHETQYHVAVWHEDLVELHEKGLVSGVTPASDYEYSLRKFEEVKSLFPSAKQDEEGNLVIPTKDGNKAVYKKPVDSSDEEWQEPKDFAILPDRTIRLTEAAYKVAGDLTWEALHDVIKSKVAPLVEIKYYDSAIREAVLQIEHQLKVFHEVDEYGQTLVNVHVAHLKARNVYKASFLKVYRSELRTLVKFVRNDYMHNPRKLERNEFDRLLARINRVYLWMQVMIKDKDTSNTDPNNPAEDSD